MLFKNFLIAADVDGTLLNSEHVIPKKNIEAINYFRDNGGVFTLATGRAIPYTRTIAREINLDVPAVVFNGGSVYDFSCNEFLWRSVLPLSVKEHIFDIKEKFPSLGINIMLGEDIYSVSSNFRSVEHAQIVGVEKKDCTFDDAPTENWDKMLIMDEIDVIDALFEYSSQLNLDGIHVTRSSPYFYEVLPGGVNKSVGLRELIKLCGYDKRYIVAVGDFNNDIEMLQMADLGIAVGNAQDEVKKIADLIVCDNNSNPISDIVAHIKNTI